MEQFSLEKYLANPSRKVVTKRGENVRILCTDRKSSHPIVALVKESCVSDETVYNYDENGNCQYAGTNIYNLFFAPEKHEGWVNIYQDEKFGNLCCRYVFCSEEEARQKRAKEAIATAKIEWEE